MPDVALLVELVGNLVAHNAAALVEASEAHDRELSDELRRPQRWLRAGQALHASVTLAPAPATSVHCAGVRGPADTATGGETVSLIALQTNWW